MQTVAGVLPSVQYSSVPAGEMAGYDYADYEGSGLELVHVSDVLDYLGRIH